MCRYVERERWGRVSEEKSKVGVMIICKSFWLLSNHKEPANLLMAATFVSI